MENLLGTAGGPMLNIITSKNLSNVLVVVTRYFGGILLGTGGLVRSYSKVTEKVLLDEDCIFKDIGLEVKFYVSYGFVRNGIFSGTNYYLSIGY